MSHEQLSAVTETGSTRENAGYSHYNPVNVDVTLDNTAGALVLALVTVTLLLVLLRMQARQQQLLAQLADGEFARGDS